MAYDALEILNIQMLTYFYQYTKKLAHVGGRHSIEQKSTIWAHNEQ